MENISIDKAIATSAASSAMESYCMIAFGGLAERFFHLHTLFIVTVIQALLVRIIFYAFSSKSIQNLQTKLMSKNNRKDCEYYVNYGSNYNTVKQTSPQSKYNPPVMLEFEGGQYYAPNDYAYLLERIYGKDYMSLPPVEKRITHKPVRICFNTNESIYQEKNNEKI